MSKNASGAIQLRQGVVCLPPSLMFLINLAGTSRAVACTNTFNYLDKYIFQFKQVHFTDCRLRGGRGGVGLRLEAGRPVCKEDI